MQSFTRIMQPIFELGAKGNIEEGWRKANPWTAPSEPVMTYYIEMRRAFY